MDSTQVTRTALRRWAVAGLLSLVVSCLLPVVAEAQPGPPERVLDRLRDVPAEAKRNPLKRYQYFYEQRAYPNSFIPPGALNRARDDHVRKFGPIREEPSTSAPTFNQNQWRPAGPFPIATTLPTSGRVNTIAIDPTNSNVIYAGAATGGVWKTVNGGASWLSITDTQCSVAMGSIAIDPLNPSIVYAGTGEANFSADSYYGCGVLKSTNGGVNWAQMGSAQFDTASGGASIAKVVIHPTATSTLLVASSFGLFRSTNSGATFTAVLSGHASDVLIDKTTPSVMYAAIGSAFGGASNGVYKSTDTGATWTKLAGGLPTTSVGRISLAIAASAPAIVMASVQNSGTYTLLGIYKTTDSGTTWAQTTASGASCGSQCWYDMTISIDPSNADIVYFGGVFLFKSTNGGTSYANIGSTIHVDHHAFEFLPGTPTTVFSGNDGGVYKSTNGGASWTSLNSNLSITQFSGGLGIHPTNPGGFIGGTQDNSTLLTTGSTTWSQEAGLNCCDGGYSAIDFTTPTTAYGETQWGGGFSGPRRTDNLGVSAFVQKNSGISFSDAAYFYPPMVMSKAIATTLYFGTTRVYKTTNRGDNWTPSGTSFSPAAVSAIAEAPSNTSVVYAGTGNGQVYRSENSNATYVLAATGLPNRYITALAVDPTNPATAYATVSGFGSGHVFKTTNSGVAWVNISGNLPDLPVSAIVVHPTTPTMEILVGTDLGVFRTRDGGVTWTPFNTGLPNVPVIDLVYNLATDVLAASTHGRGVFVASLGGAASPVTPRDFDASGTSDILWRNSNNGQVYLWLLNGIAILGSGSPGNASADWIIQGAGDFDGSRKFDILWRNATTGQVYIWFMDGTTLVGGGSPGSADAGWVIQGAWDFNGDGRSDILWRNSTTGQLYIWFLNATATAFTSGGSPGGASSDWVIERGGDFNGDGKIDLVWRNTTTGQVYIWLLDGASLIDSGSPGGASADWLLEGAGDFNQDGRSDIFWRNGNSGQTYIWLMNGNSITGSGSPGAASADWVVQQLGDSNGDAKSDIVWRNTTSLQVVVWLMDGVAIQTIGSPGSATLDWVIQRNRD